MITESYNRLFVWKDRLTGSFKISSGGGPAKPLDDIKSLHDYLGEKIDFLELDIGGIETQVLLECEDRLKNVKKILVRYYSLVGQSQPLHILLELLMRNGFRYNMNAIDPPEHPFIKEERDAKIYLGADERLDIMGTR